VVIAAANVLAMGVFCDEREGCPPEGDMRVAGGMGVTPGG
jgi:hypothetical protein